TVVAFASGVAAVAVASVVAAVLAPAAGVLLVAVVASVGVDAVTAASVEGAGVGVVAELVDVVAGGLVAACARIAIGAYSESSDGGVAGFADVATGVVGAVVVASAVDASALGSVR